MLKEFFSKYISDAIPTKPARNIGECKGNINNTDLGN